MTVRSRLRLRALTAALAATCVSGVLSSNISPALAEPRAVAQAQPVSEADALKAKIADLKVQRAKPGANVVAIDADIAKLQARLAQIAPNPAPESSSGPAVENAGVATRTTISRRELQQENAQNTYDAIKNVPGVAQADAKAGGGADNLQIRGIHLTSNTGYRLDGGLPIVNNVIMSTEDKERVQVLKGAGALEYGIASPAGIINYVMKRATKAPINEVSLGFTDNGQAITGLDIGRKFGYGDRYGVRMNVAGGDTGGYVQGTGGTRWVGAMTADYTSDNMRVRLDYERFGINIVEQASLLQNKAGSDGRIVLPRLPDPTKLLSGDWDRQVAGGQNMMARADFRLTDQLSFVAESGRSDAGRDHRIVSQIGTYNVVTGKGTETLNFVRDQRYVNTFANLGLTLKTQRSDWFGNALTVGYTRNERWGNNPVTTTGSFKQNIYDPTVVDAPLMPTGPIAYQPQDTRDYDYYLTDTMTLGKRVRITGGLRQINYTADITTAGGIKHNLLSYSAPALGTVIDVTRNLSVYGSFVKSLEESPTAPINAANKFEVLPPAPATQKELGLRANGRGIAATLAYFSIDRANSTIDPITNIFGLNGTNTFAGFEATLTTRVAPRLSLTAGGQIMNAVQHAPDDPTINGKIPENTPHKSGSLNLSYVPHIAGLEVHGGLQYLSERELDPENQGTIPAVTLVNGGLSYSKRIGERRVTFNLNCRNCADKRYWSSAVNGALGVGAPRTISLTARFSGGQ